MGPLRQQVLHLPPSGERERHHPLGQRYRIQGHGIQAEEYIGKFIGDFHVDELVVNDILGRLTRDETVNAYPVGHTRCFTTEVGEKAWKAW
jgi:hypothetical protein